MTIDDTDDGMAEGGFDEHMLGAVAATVHVDITQWLADQQPCPTCGGDRLRPAYDGRSECHAPMGRRRCGDR